MKKLLLIILLTFSANAQNISVKSINQFTQLDQGQFFHPQISPKGELLFTGAGYTGLYLMDLSGNIKTLSEEPGAGYEPAFSEDGSYVYFRPYKYEGMKKVSSLIKKDITQNSEKVLIKDERDFTSAKRLPGGSVAVSRNAAFFVADEAQNVSKSIGNETAAFIEKGKIALYKNGEKTILTPNGDGFYLWPSISPDGTKLLFTKAGKGTFISTLDGEILVELGYANAPRWSPDGQWVVFMRDLDDGHQIIESDIFVISADGKNTIAITETEDIKEVYPFWGPENEIVFGSEKGIIFKAILEK
ncbi:MAG: hypothetical protein D8M58_09750 [Calditrichaeota bacterium]|nr:MAG: hypothetical protein DWQ03_09125 [Calditrichota bacterium]MBL1205672.1 hypothetical protein [Calditrichota bacterium]NOG45500.1 hypothetical protein [Calditrichota bacterium]